MENKKLCLSVGLILNIKEDNFIYKHNESSKFSRDIIILNHLNNSIIGIHKEMYKEKNKIKINGVLNIGIFMKNIVDDINNNLSSLIEKK